MQPAPHRARRGSCQAPITAALDLRHGCYGHTNAQERRRGCDPKPQGTAMTRPSADRPRPSVGCFSPVSATTSRAWCRSRSRLDPSRRRWTATFVPQHHPSVPASSRRVRPRHGRTAVRLSSCMIEPCDPYLEAFSPKPGATSSPSTPEANEASSTARCRRSGALRTRRPASRSHPIDLMKARESNTCSTARPHFSD